MIKVKVTEVAPLYEQYDSQQIAYLYNGLDCCLTREIADQLIPQVANNLEARLNYSLTRALQSPALELDFRGLFIDKVAKFEAIQTLEAKAHKVQKILDSIAEAVWGKGLNANSHKQLTEFFYKVMHLPPQKVLTGGRWKVSTGREALEKLAVFHSAKIPIRCILDIRDYRKKMSVLKKGLDPDGRIRTSYNIVGTDTGRWSSSKNAFNTGDNLQNWTDDVRDICIADEGMKMAYIDLQSAESQAVAFIADDEEYIKACTAGDPHTLVAKMVWPKLEWNQGLPDRKIADQNFYRSFSYRDMAKRGGHGTNYYGKPPTMAKHLQVEPYIMETFQMKYFAAFPGITAWHQTVATAVQSTGKVTGPMVTGRTFWGRRSDDTTLRGAIAHGPQSTVANVMNLGIHQLWTANIPHLQILAQVHDAVLVQYPAHMEDKIVPQMMEILRVPVTYPSGKTMTIAFDAEVGWNWAHKNANNPDGLTKWTGNDTRKRTRSAKVSLLDCTIL